MGDLTLDDKYTATEGDVVMSGIQALVRLPLDQHRADLARGLRTATLVSGYRGSPLGGLDMAFDRASTLVRAHNITFMPGVNEDLAATAIYGSQISHLFEGPRYDGVLGMWYGKGPGVDRTGDAFRHANVAGVGPNGGVLAVAGDDPSAKSSTVASASELALVDAGMPVLYPANVADVLRLGLVGFALSRYCGSWVGLKIVTNVADAFSTVSLRPLPEFACPSVLVDGREWTHSQNPRLLAPGSLEQERDMHEGRAVAVRSFLAANRVNELVCDPPDAWLGIVAAGKTFADVVEALDGLGLDFDGAARLGIRVLKLGAIHPIEPQIVGEFARGLDEIVVVEEKRAFIELFLRDVLYGRAGAPRIVGKFDEENRFLFPGYGELDADKIRPLLRARLIQRIDAQRLAPEPQRPRRGQLIPLTAAETRTPYFCSGCPHNRSTQLPEGSIANGAVGCSTMAMWMDRNTDNIVQMGAEGGQWIGAAPFTETPHIFQNMGDGTFLHSGSLAIRQAVAARTNITYKLLYNAAVAMTGGQSHDADLGLGDIVCSVQAEGVSRIIVVSDQPDMRREDVPSDVEVWHRDRVIEAQTVLRALPGVTVMVYDQACAADLRRKRKRGEVPTPAERVMINEAVCEGCGDCGAKSNCLSVQPVETVLGRKTRIHQASCNFDETCTTGHCPAFVKVTPGPKSAASSKSSSRVVQASVDLVPPKQRALASEVSTTDIVMVGVGGTGVVTVNQILGVAARLDGKYSTGLDQTGLAQKGGSVVSHLRISSTPILGANLIGQGGADVMLAFDAITAAQETNLERMSSARTTAVVNTSLSPTGPQVRDVHASTPHLETLVDRIRACSRDDLFTVLDADARCEELFGTQAPSNVMILGAAFQQGLLPLSAESIETAIELNGSAVSGNIAAFRAGRQIVAAAEEPSVEPKTAISAKRPDLPKTLRVQMDRELPIDVHALVETCLTNLIGFQDLSLAQRYLDEVCKVARCEQAGMSQLTASVARELHHLLAYKDEYEVARLHRSAAFRESVQSQFGGDASTKFLLQPPVLARVGVTRKIAFDRSAAPMFAALAGAKRLRGTRLDPFGRTPHRRMERALADELRAHISLCTSAIDSTRSASAASGSDPGGPASSSSVYEAALALIDSANQVRGFDHVKERNVDAWRIEAATLVERLQTAVDTATRTLIN